MFTFKTERPTGKYRSFEDEIYHIKLNKKQVGQISAEYPHKISLMVIKDDINEDGNPNCQWKWIRLVRYNASVPDAKEWQDVISEALGVQPIEINSKYFVPQSRPRLFWTNIKVENIPTISNHCLNDILEDATVEYYLTEKQKSKLNLNYKWSENEIIRHKAGKHQQDNIYRYDGLMACLSASHHGAARHLTKTYLPNGEIRRLTENEVEKLQGVPTNYTKIVSSSKRYEVLGNGWTVDVISFIFSFLRGGNF